MTNTKEDEECIMLARRVMQQIYPVLFGQITDGHDENSSEILAQRNLKRLVTFCDAFKSVTHVLSVDLKRQALRLPPCFIDRLPLELLSRILEDALELKYADRWRNIHKIGLVCKAWKMFADNPKFWSPLDYSDPYGIRRQVLCKNPDGPLKIYLMDHEDYEVANTEVLRLADIHRRRVQSFEWHGRYREDEIANYLSEPTPALDHLDLGSYETVDFDLSDGCNLRHLELSNVTLPWASPRLSGLRKLRIIMDEPRSRIGDFPSLNVIKGILVNSPQIEHLMLRSKKEPEIESAVFPKSNTISLPSLEFIKIAMGDSNYALEILSVISAVACQKLKTSRFDSSQFAIYDSPGCQTVGPILRQVEDVGVAYRGGPRSILQLLTPNVAKRRIRYSIDIMMEDEHSGNRHLAWTDVAQYLQRTLKPGTDVSLEVGDRDCPGWTREPLNVVPLSGFMEHSPFITRLIIGHDEGSLQVLNYLDPRDDGTLPCPALRLLDIRMEMSDLRSQEICDTFTSLVTKFAQSYRRENGVEIRVQPGTTHLLGPGIVSKA